MDINMNYDTVFKEAMVLFKDKSLDFLGLHGIAPIDEPLKTENVQIEINTEFLDLTFGLKDGRGVHFEEEVDLSRDDMLRFGTYHLGLSRVYKREFITVVFVKNPTSIKDINTEQLVFKPIIVQCSKIDADTMLKRIKNCINNNESVNELEIIYLPLFHSSQYTPTELFKESIALIKRLQIEESRRHKIFALLLVLAGKVVDKSQLEETWEELRLMGNAILEYAEARGMAAGIAIGRTEGIAVGRTEGIAVGRTEGILTIARNMLKRHKLIEEIMEDTGLTRVEIEFEAGKL
jgi:predicted transposase/invertase (TIGR01784 family)